MLVIKTPESLLRPLSLFCFRKMKQNWVIKVLSVANLVLGTLFFLTVYQLVPSIHFFPPPPPPPPPLLSLVHGQIPILIAV